MKKRKLPIGEESFLEKIGGLADKVPKELAGVPASTFVKLIRGYLHMTQAQLAKRAGVPQSHIAKIETGKIDVQVSTLKKVFDALNNDLLIIPRPRQRLDSIIEERIQERVRKNVGRITGTMALEKQQPDRRLLRKLMEAEKAKLRQNPSSEIWEDQ